jgi:ArsR family transcriptional regulator
MDGPMKSHEQTAELLKALAHPARLQIAGILREGEACVCHLEAHLGYRQPYISQQIMVLRKAGLLAERRDGTFIFYRIADSRVVKILDILIPVSVEEGSPAPRRRVHCSCPECAPVVAAHA